jgi:hypothetical protein
MHVDKICLVDLTESERSQLIALVKRGAVSAYRIRNAQILLNADINVGDDEPPKIDAAIASYLHCHSKTVSNVRKRFVEQGLERTLERKPRDTPPPPRSSTVRRRPGSSRLPVAPRRRGEHAGRYSYLPIPSLNSRLLRVSRTVQFAGS